MRDWDPGDWLYLLFGIAFLILIFGHDLVKAFR